MNIAKPEILRLILRGTSRDLTANRAVFVCRVAILYLNVSAPSLSCNLLLSLTTWTSSRGQKPGQPIPCCFGNQCHFQAFDSNHNQSYNGRLWTRIRAEGQGNNENVKQYAPRLACHNENDNELKNIYKYELKRRYVKNANVHTILHVGSLVPVPLMHASKMVVHLSSFAFL